MVSALNILVACEFSGVVRDAFVRLGHNAVSGDLLPSETPGEHYIGDVAEYIDNDWDMLIAFPPCTYLTRAGAKNWKQNTFEQDKAVRFVRWLMDAPIHSIAIENPPGYLSTAIRKPEQIIHPWQFGHPETKTYGLWLKNLPHLQYTNVISDRDKRLYNISGNSLRGKERSRMYTGIADAMAIQWGGVVDG